MTFVLLYLLIYVAFLYFIGGPLTIWVFTNRWSWRWWR